MTERLSWGILGTGFIARRFARALAESRTGKLVAVGSRTRAEADRFGAELGIDRRYAGYEALLRDPDVQVVYIATPHPMHAEWAIRAAEAGKHVLCEKPIGINHAEAMAIVEAAHRHDVFLMEAYMYRCHPQTAKLLEMIREGAVGEVRAIQAAFSFDIGATPEHRLLRHDLAGGAILDIGGYCTSMAGLIAGAALGTAVVEPEDVTGTALIGEESRVDEYAAAILTFPGGIIAELAAGVRLRRENSVWVFGSEGMLHLPDPWVPGKDTRILLYRKDAGQPEEIAVRSDRDLYALEADAVAEHLEDRRAPAMTWEDTLANMRTLDRWREAVGMVYDSEQPEAQLRPVHGRPLSVRPENNFMKYGEIAGVGKPLSRLVMGADNQIDIRRASVMFDDYFERGGNCFDTAHYYFGGKSERTLGWWVRSRGVRDEVVILDKGAHSPHCYPEYVTQNLIESLERLQMDYVDIYMLHRDNPEVPVGEFVDVLNEHHRAGRIRAFGGSNWTIQRVEAANEYARRHGLVGFSAISNNLSLARMVSPFWEGVVSSSDAESRAWFTRTQMPLMPWSSQARGFFTGRIPKEYPAVDESIRAWHSEDNFERRERVFQLARERGILPVSIVLAYVLCQPFPTFPLIGPRTLEETRTSFLALDLQLTPTELHWLNLEE